MKPEERYEQIERYLEGYMSESESAAFEHEASINPNLAEEIHIHRAVHSAIADGALLNVKKRLQRIHETKTGKGIHRSFWLDGRIAVWAAALLMTVLLGYSIWQRSSSMEETKSPIANVKKPPSLSDAEPPTESNSNAALPPVPKAENAEPQRQNPAPPKADSENDEPKPKPALPKETERIAVKSAYGESAEIDDLSAPPTVAKKESNEALAYSNRANDPDVTKLNVTPAAVSIVAKVETRPECLGANDGQILIDPESVSGGTPPYRFSVNGNDHFFLQNRFEGLAEGTYRIFAQDSKGRISLVGETYVDSHICEEEAILIRVGDPQSNYWELPLSEGGTCRVDILDRAGQVVFSADKPVRWYGNDRSGNPLPAGSYAYRLICEGQVAKNGTLTLAR